MSKFTKGDKVRIINGEAEGAIAIVVDTMTNTVFSKAINFCVVDYLTKKDMDKIPYEDNVFTEDQLEFAEDYETTTMRRTLHQIVDELKEFVERYDMAVSAFHSLGDKTIDDLVNNDPVEVDEGESKDEPQVDPEISEGDSLEVKEVKDEEPEKKESKPKSAKSPKDDILDKCVAAVFRILEYTVKGSYNEDRKVRSDCEFQIVSSQKIINEKIKDPHVKSCLIEQFKELIVIYATEKSNTYTELTGKTLKPEDIKIDFNTLINGTIAELSNSLPSIYQF